MLPGPDPMGFFGTVAVGILGALVGYFIFTALLGIGDSDKFDLGGIIGAVIGTMLVLLVYRAVVDREQFPADLRWNAAAIWVGPNCHLVHYPLRGGEQYNVVVTFHSREREQWSVREGSRDEVQSSFEGICPRARQLIDLPKDWKRWATADRDPIGQWNHGRVTLLGDAAHPTLQYLAQGACMAMEDAVTLGEAVRVTAGRHGPDVARAFELYQRSRVARTARVVLSAREMGRIFHARGVERLVRNDLWKGRTPERFYDALEWLYGWTEANCLAQ